MKIDYKHMSDKGRRFAEYLELSERYYVLKRRAAWHPGYKAPKGLQQEIASRRAELSDVEMAAVADLRSGRQTQWTPWLEKHLKENPTDALPLYFLVADLEHNSEARQACGRYDFPWRMNHAE